MDSYAWHERADRLDNEARKALEKKQIVAKSRLLEEQAKAGELLRLQGLKMIDDENFNFRDERNAITAIEKGIAIERKALGITDDAYADVTGDNNNMHDINETALLAAIKRMRRNAEWEKEDAEDERA